jgi:hypothetical protein
LGFVQKIVPKTNTVKYRMNAIKEFKMASAKPTIRIKEVIVMGIFSTIIMDIGSVFLEITQIVKGSMEPQFLGRWILNMFDGEFIQENIRIAAQMSLEIPVSITIHYLTGIFLVGIFLLLRRRFKMVSGSIYMGLVFGWITLLIPWLFFYPCIGFGFFGLDTPEGLNNIVYSTIYHSFFGLGITLWLVSVRKFVFKIKQGAR